MKSILWDEIKLDFLGVKPNIFGELHNFSQSYEPDTRNDCWFFSADFWNLLYNTGFWLYEKDKTSLEAEEEIRHISEGLKMGSVKTGFQTETAEVIFNYFKKFDFVEKEENASRDKVQLIKFNKMSPVFNVWLKLGYAIRILIWGSPSFFNEGRTLGEIKTYQKGALNHFINVQIAMRDINEVIKKWDYFVQDNYFWKGKYNVYKIDFSKFASSFLIGNNCYAFIINY